MLLSTTSKVFSKIILKRLGAGIDPQLCNGQAGSRKGMSCSDHIFTLRQILEQSKACGHQLSENFSIKTGVKQGCILSPFLFILCIGWLMKKITKAERQGITWTLTNVLEDIDFADNICLL